MGKDKRAEAKVDMPGARPGAGPSLAQSCWAICDLRAAEVEKFAFSHMALGYLMKGAAA